MALASIYLRIVVATFALATVKGDGVCNFYQHSAEGYTCELKTIVSFSTPESNNFLITGNHMSGKSDSDVRFIITKDSKMDYIPPSIFTKFVNLWSVDFSKVELQALTSNTFQRANNVRNFWLYENKIPALPGNLFANTKAEYVSFSKNDIMDVSWNAFANMTNLYKLELQQNKLKGTIDPRLFQNLANLKELIVWENQLTEIPVDAFKNLQKLEYLSLGNNTYVKLETTPFKLLTSLKSLDLDLNEIKYIEKGFFDALPKLENFKFVKNVCADFNMFGIKNVQLEVLPRINNCFNDKITCQATCKIIKEL